MVEGASFTRRFDIDKIMQICWFRFMKAIVSNRYDYALYALFNFELIKRFESRSDVRVPRTAGDGAN